MMSYSRGQNWTEVANDPAHHVRWLYGGGGCPDVHRSTADSEEAHAKVKRCGREAPSKPMRALPDTPEDRADAAPAFSDSPGWLS